MHGIDPKALGGWPLVTLPENAITVASEFGGLCGRSLRDTAWQIRGLGAEGGGYLTDDPSLELPHLRNEPGETVGIYQSDLANGAIEDGTAAEALESMDMMGLSPTDNGTTGQIFALLDFDRPEEQLDYAALGRLLADWLRTADVDTALRSSHLPAALDLVDEESGLHISRTMLH